MRIIEKVEIKHFRSFDWGVWQEKVEIINLKDFNIFSGANDSWKSNVLRALNLFFNDEISPWVPFDFDRDLSNALRERSDEKISNKRDAGGKWVRQKDLWVKIRVHFTKETEWVLPKNFYVEKMWDKNGLNYTYRKANLRKDIDSNKIRAQEWQLTQFLNNIRFEYVPAVKDRQFFHYLFQKLQKSLFEKQDKIFSEQSEKFNDILRKETRELFEDFKSNTNIDATFSIPETLIDFFRTLTIETNGWVSLFDRGDWMQARFIPDILNEISKGSKKKIIWGFEEPENSYESKNIRRLRDDFLEKFCDEKQLFITTHSSEFLAIRDERVSIYRVFKTPLHTSQISIFDEENSEWEKVCDDLWIIFESRIIEDVQKQLADQSELLMLAKISEEDKKRISVKLRQDIEECLSKLKTVEREISEFKKPNVFVEDEYSEIYKIAWLKLNGLNPTIADFQKQFDDNCQFTINGKHWNKPLSQFLDSPTVDEWKGKKVVWIFDFDTSYNDFNWLKNQRWDVQQGGESDWISRTRKDHPDFHALLLPVPSHRSGYASLLLKHDSILEIELYFQDTVLTSLGCIKDKIIPGSGSNSVKIFSWNKCDFWKKLFNLIESDFDSFKQLFNRINFLLSLPQIP